MRHDLRDGDAAAAALSPVQHGESSPCTFGGWTSTAHRLPAQDAEKLKTPSTPCGTSWGLGPGAPRAPSVGCVLGWVAQSGAPSGEKTGV